MKEREWGKGQKGTQQCKNVQEKTWGQWVDHRKAMSKGSFEHSQAWDLIALESEVALESTEFGGRRPEPSGS